MPKLIDKLDPSEEFGNFEGKKFLEGIINFILTTPESPDDHLPKENLSAEVVDFYRNYYIPLNSQGELPKDCDLEEKVSSHEYALWNYCCKPSSETKICVVHGHRGVGKSSLIRRIVYYFYSLCPFLQKSFLPIYIRPVDVDPTVSAQEFKTYLYEEIFSATYRVTLPLLRLFQKKFLKELNFRSRFGLQGTFSKSTIKKIEKGDLEDRINKLFSDDPHKKHIFYIDLLGYLNRNKHTNVVVVLDDVDKLSPQIHTGAFLCLDKLARIGIYSIVCMRTSTFRQEASKILQSRDKEIEINLNPELSTSIFRTRVNLSNERVHLLPFLPFKVEGLEDVDAETVARCFCELLNHPVAMKALIRLSNMNLKSLFEKFRLMVRSQAFSDGFIVTELVKKATVSNYRGPASRLWIFYNLLFGNYCGTFSSDDDPNVVKAGLVNLFDSFGTDYSPWKHMVPINILIYLYRRWKVSTEEEEFVNVLNLYNEFTSAVGTEVDEFIFTDTIYRLVESEIILTKSCTPYAQKSEVLSKMFEHSVRISQSGIFYLDNLIHKVEYMSFMKDDIDWNPADYPRRMKTCRRDMSRRFKFKNVLQVTAKLMEIEYKALDSLRMLWKSSERGEKGLRKYRDSFSPFGLMKRLDISIYGALFSSYLKFIRRCEGRAFERSSLRRIAEKTEKWRRQNDGIVRSFVEV